MMRTSSPNYDDREGGVAVPNSFRKIDANHAGNQRRCESRANADINIGEVGCRATESGAAGVDKYRGRD
jgi:hypothetical protein